MVMQSRLLELDTQEAPRGPGRRDCQAPQPLWREERQFLQEELRGLRGDIDCYQARIIGDFNRLLLDICGAYNAETLPEEDECVPTLPRLKMAKRALCTGCAFPKNHYFVTNDLWQEFQEAIRQRKGGFSREEFVHPSLCRRERYRMEIAANVRR